MDMGKPYGDGSVAEADHRASILTMMSVSLRFLSDKELAVQLAVFRVFLGAHEVA